ncbi:Pycsar system effector family protein [Streptomyces sp. NPDC021608]|uniref:Pycsar system effector family protein n=1 Tax=Streptomyces sp. NPDC021608 TaxID=3154903 RepID=UPI0033E67124
MTVTTTAAADVTRQNLDSALSALQSEVSRTDSKASLLLAFQGAALAGLASLAPRDMPPAAKAFGVLAVLALGMAVVLLLLVVRPRLRGDDRGSFPYWARLTEPQIRECMGTDTRTARIRVLSQIVLTKFLRLRRAVDCTLAALALLALAAGCAAVL